MAASGDNGHSRPPAVTSAPTDRGPSYLQAEFKKAHDGLRPIERLEVTYELTPGGATEFSVVKTLDESARRHNSRMQALLRDPQSFRPPETRSQTFERESGLARARLREQGPEILRRQARGRQNGRDGHDR
jgi:hypothetical protein